MLKVNIEDHLKQMLKVLVKKEKKATLRDWFQKEDWRRVDDPSKKCGE